MVGWGLRFLANSRHEAWKRNTLACATLAQYSLANLRADGFEVRETVLSFEDAHAADEIFLSGNFAKVTAVKEFDGTHYPHRPVTDRARALYMQWAATQA